MRRVIVTVALIGAALAAVAAVPASGAAGCVTKVAWQGATYKAVRTTANADIPLGRRLGTAAVIGCATTNTAPPGYSAAPRATVRHSIFAVAGVHSQVAVAMRGASTTRLFMSTAKPSAAEQRVLNRLRGR
jgi:uncharacterized protein DUF6281